MNSSQYCLVKGKTLAWRDVLPSRREGRTNGPRMKVCPICGYTGLDRCSNKTCRLSITEYYRCKRIGIKFIKPQIIKAS
jgi:hypothetical protein